MDVCVTKPKKPAATFNPDVFAVNSLEEAKNMVVGPLGFRDKDGKVVLFEPMENRWVNETKYTIQLISEKFNFEKTSKVFDYGCGCGRLSKGLIDKFGCQIMGIDQSDSMKKIALDYVNSSQFAVCYPEQIPQLNFKADFCFSVFVLQHSGNPERDIELIYNSLGVGAKFFIINEDIRFVPTKELGWANDGKDIKAMVTKKFGNCIEGKLDPLLVPHLLAERTFWSLHER